MIKKQSIGIWMNVIVVLLTLVSFIAYGVNISSEGYFKNASVSNLITYGVVAVLMLVLVIILAQKEYVGTTAMAVEIVSGILRIIAPVLLTLCLIGLVSARAEGLGFIYFSNEDVLKEIQTAENMSSAMGTIINMICLGISAVAAMVAAFFGLRKE